MKRSFAAILLFGSLAHAEGPLFQHKESVIQQEYENVYQSIRQALSNKGTATNDNALSGDRGQYISSVTATATNFPATTVFGDILSMPLTPGDWDITAVLAFEPNGSTSTNFTIGISSFSGTSSTGLSNGINRLTRTLGSSGTDNTTVPNIRFSVFSSTTVYLKYVATYSAGQPQAIGSLIARRPR